MAEPTKHNGRSHVAGPQAAAKALLGGPAARDPRYVLRPLGPCARGLLLTACSNKPHAGQPLVCVVTAGAVTTGYPVRRVPRSVSCWPRPPAEGQALTRLWPAPGQARPPPRGSLLPGAGALCCWPAWCLCRRRSRLADASPRNRTPSLLGGEGAAAVPGSKGRCAPRKRGGPWPALTA